MHILIRFDLGGIETWLLNILKHYDRHLFQMDVCLIGRRGEHGVLAGDVISAGSQVHLIPLRNPILFWRKFSELSSRYQVIIVHTNPFISPFVLFPALFEGKCLRFIMLHNTKFAIPNNVLYNLVNKSLQQRFVKIISALNLLMSTGVLACSQASLDQSYSNWKKSKKFHVLHLGIETNQFTNVNHLKILRASLQIPENANVVGHVGRFDISKNHHNFIHMAKYISKKNTNTHFLLIGDGPLRPKIEQEINKLNLQERFHLTGIRRDVPQLMKIMDVAYFPSLYEGFPMTFIEAQASGLVLVTGNRPEMQEAVCPPNHPWCIIDTDDIQLSGNAILYLIANPNVRNRIAVAGKKWVARNFSIEKSVRTLEKILLNYV